MEHRCFVDGIGRNSFSGRERGPRSVAQFSRIAKSESAGAELIAIAKRRFRLTRSRQVARGPSFLGVTHFFTPILVSISETDFGRCYSSYPEQRWQSMCAMASDPRSRSAILENCATALSQRSMA